MPPGIGYGPTRRLPQPLRPPLPEGPPVGPTPDPGPLGLRSQIPMASTIEEILMSMSGMEPGQETWGTAAGKGLGSLAMAGPVRIKSLAKDLDDLLGMVFAVAGKAKGLPQRLRMTKFNPQANRISMHDATDMANPTRYDVTPDQLDDLVAQGLLDLDVPRGLARQEARLSERLTREFGPVDQPPPKPARRAVASPKDKAYAAVKEKGRGTKR